jgi:uncharacterized protein (TIGR00255 family)
MADGSKTVHLSSMTGFARTSGDWNGEHWAWELKSVNGKALDTRFRLPAGCEGLETTARSLIGSRLKRGNVQINLVITAQSKDAPPKVNTALLNDLVQIASDLRAKHGGGPVDVEQLLQVRGVLEFTDAAPDEVQLKAREQVLLRGLEQAVDALVRSRMAEGAKLSAVLHEQLSRIESLTRAARDCPARSIELQKKRLADAVAKLVEAHAGLDPQRLHQEAALLQTKADIQEELDRLSTHIETARGLLNATEAVGRKLDFLMQEFNREANTLCSKSPDASLTSIGLDLKTVIDQMREQVQNIE